MIPDPLKEWYSNPSNLQQLEAALNNPVVQKAIAVLQRVSLPKHDYTDRTSAEAITHAAMEQNRSAGFHSYMDELWSLTELPAKPPQKPEGYSKSYVIEWAKENGLWEDFDKQQEQTEEQKS